MTQNRLAPFCRMAFKLSDLRKLCNHDESELPPFALYASGPSHMRQDCSVQSLFLWFWIGWEEACLSLVGVGRARKGSHGDTSIDCTQAFFSQNISIINLSFLKTIFPVIRGIASLCFFIYNKRSLPIQFFNNLK